ncbi:MAG: tetratricopeptide repeat protein, partial [Desulfomonilaceae bacterium]
MRRSDFVPTVMVFLLLMLSTTIRAAESGHIGEPTPKMKAILEQASRDYENALSREDLEKAAKNYQDILLFLEKYNLEKELGLALRGLGLVYFSQGEYFKSIECYEKALDKSRKAADHGTEASVQENIGSVYVAWGQYHKALNYFTEALSSSTKLGDSKTQGETFGELGNLYSVWGKFKQAQETYAAALEKSKSAHDSKIEALTLIRIGQLENKLGLYARATSRLDSAMVLSKNLGNNRFQATILTELGKGESDQGQPENALKYFEEALKVYKRIGIMPPSFTEVLGNTYLEAGRIPEAERFLRLTERESSMGRLYLIKGEHAKARPVYEVLLRSAEKNSSADNLFIAYTGLGIIYENAENYQQAALYYSRATEQLEEIRAGLAQDERSTFFNVKIGGFYRTAPYEGLARVRILLNQPSEALRDSEYVKARTFAETVAGRFGTQANAVPKEISLQDRELNQTLASLLKQRQQAEEKQNREVLEGLEPQIKEARRRLNDYVDELRQKHPLYAAVAYPKPMDLDQSSLAPGEWTLAFAVTDTGVCIWLLNGKKIVKVLFKPIQRKTLDELVRKFREPFEGLNKSNFAQKLKSFDFQSGMKLSDCLLGDIISSLPKGVPVIIVPHDSLGVLPFEMLPLSTSGIIEMRKDVPCVTGAEFFGDRNPASYNQSITALTLARTLGKHTLSGDKVLIVADPVFEVNDTRAQLSTSQSAKLTSDEAKLYKELMVAVEDGKVGSLRFERLALTGDLAKKLVDLYKGKTDLYKDLDANKERFLKDVAPNLHQFREIIFATHGYFGKNLPGIMEPVLVLTTVPSGTDGYLRMSEVMSLDMSA